MSGDLFRQGSALFSPDLRYRYVLERRLREGTLRLLMVMVNPSTASGTEDDPTIRRCLGFTTALGFDVLTVVNLFALVSTDVRQLLAVNDPVGPENDKHLQREAAKADMVIAGWGAKTGKLGLLVRRRAVEVATLVRPAQLHALRLTKGGDPEHPLFLPASLTPFQLTQLRLA